MTALFKRPKVPTPPAPEPPPPVPSTDAAREAVDQRDRMRRRSGRASTVLASNPGYRTGTNTMLGQ